MKNTRIWIVVALAVGALVWSAPGAVVAEAPSPREVLDPSFGEFGEVVALSGTAGRARVALRPDGGFYMYEPRLAAMRSFDIDGQVIGSFGVAGEVAIDSPDLVAADSSGRLVVAELVGPSAGVTWTVRVARYLPSGDLDPTFGGGGVTLVVTDERFLVELIVSPENEIAFRSGPMWKLTESGQLDTAFGSGGSLAVDGQVVGNLNVDAFFVVGDSIDGRFLQVDRFDFDGTLDVSFERIETGTDIERGFVNDTGRVIVTDCCDFGTNLWVFDADGSLNTTATSRFADSQPVGSYGTGGFLLNEFDAASEERVVRAYDATDELDTAFADDGQLFVTGLRVQQVPDGSWRLLDSNRVRRYQPGLSASPVLGGDIDTEFGFGSRVPAANTNGFVTTRALVPQEDGSLVEVDSRFLSGTRTLTARRLDATGGVDASFGTVSLGEYSLGTGALAPALGRNATTWVPLITSQGVGLARLNASGIDSSWGDAGVLSIDASQPFTFGESDIRLYSFRELDDGSVMLGLRSFARRPYVVKLRPDASVDTSWGDAGYLYTGSFGTTELYFGADGSTIATTNTTVSPVVARYTPDGTLDESFQTPVFAGASDFAKHRFHELSDGSLLFAVRDEPGFVAPGPLWTVNVFRPDGSTIEAMTGRGIYDLLTIEPDDTGGYIAVAGAGTGSVAVKVGSDGEIDSSFFGDGSAEATLGGFRLLATNAAYRAGAIWFAWTSTDRRAWISRIGTPVGGPIEPPAPAIGEESLPGVGEVRSAALTRSGETVLFIDDGDDVDRFDGDVSSPDDWQILNVGDLDGDEFVAVAAAETVRDVAVATVLGDSSEWDELQVRTEVNGEFQIAHSSWLDFTEFQQRAEFSNDGERLVYAAIVDADAPVSQQSDIRDSDLEGNEDLETDVYVWNNDTETFRRLTVDYDFGGETKSFSTFDSYDADISGDGEWVVFVTDLDIDDIETGSKDPDIVVRRSDVLGVPHRISKTPDGDEAAPLTGLLVQHSPALSDDGRFVAYASNASGLDNFPNDSGAVIVHDRGAATDSAGNPLFDVPGATTTTVVNGFALGDVHSLDIDGSGLTVSITYTRPNGQHEWALYRRTTTTSSFDGAAAQLRSLESVGDSETDLSRDGNTVMIRDGAQLYQIDIAGFGSNLPDFSESHGRTPTRSRPVVSDPVNTATGALVAAATDLPAPSGAPMLSWERTYDSQLLTPSPLGRGWRSSWDVAIDPRRTNPVFVNRHGGEYTFIDDGSGGYTRSDEILADLTATTDGFELAWFSGDTWRFDPSGRLVGKLAWDGTGVTATRSDSGILERLDATTGQSILFDYDTATGELTAASLSDGRTVDYSHVGGNLVSADNPDGETLYGHDRFDRLVSETDAIGVIVHVTEYGEDGRVIRQALPTGEITLFSYDDELRTTTVTDVESGDVVVYAFDEAARLVSITDPAGNTTLSNWNVDGQPAGSTDRLGHSPSATYDSNGNVTSVTDPVRGVTSYTYDDSNRVTSVTEPTGAVTSMTYDGTDRIPSSVTDALGNSTMFTIGDGLITSVVDADGVSTSYVYDAQRRMTEMTNGLGYSWSYEYDAVGRQTRSTTPLGFVTARTFDDAGRMLTSTAADGGVTTYVYDADGRVLSTTDAVGAVTSNSYDPVTGLLASTTDPAGRVTEYTYNALSELVAVEANDGGVSETDYGTLGRVTATRDPLGRETTYAYDANGNRTEVVAPDGGVTRTEFDTAGRISALEDPIGRRTTHAYDDFGRLVSVTQPDGTVMSYTYDLLGRQVETIAPDGGITATAFTPAGRTDSVTDPEAGVTSYSYDAAGQMDAVTDPNGFITAFDYDPDGRRTAVITPEGLVTNWEYDPMGRITKIIDPAGIELTRTYTLRGELETEQREGDGVVNYVYNADGTMASVADALGNTTTFTYDAAGRQDTRVDVTGAVEVMEYNTAGELVAQVDRLGQRTEIVYDVNGRIDTVADPSGRTTDHDYDAAGQLLDRTFGDGTTISYEYDDLGRRVEMDDPTGVTTYSYDANGRPVEVAAPNGTLGYTYDLAGRRTGLTYPDGTTVTYDYDAAGRLIGLTDPNTGDVDYTLDDDGRLVLTELPNGQTRSFEFVNGQMVNHQDHGRTTALTYDESGRIATLSGAQNHAYTYDQAGQLLNAVQDEGTYAYTYGTRGEITSITDPDRTRTFTHNANVEIATVTDGDGETGSVSYDEAGRMTEHRDPDGTVTTYVYDARGLLVETTITTPGDDGGGPEVDPCAGLVATITGTDGDDVIEGTWQDDIIFGLGGNDTINGASGSDIICGGEGDDTISGQSQDDTIYAGAGNDIVSGDSGADIIDGGSGDDVLEGNSQADIIQGGDGDDSINGNSGPDILDGGNGNDVVDGSWQNDTCDDAEQAISCETITFNGESNDPPTDPPGTPILCNGLVATIVGTPGDDVLNGTWQDDVIVGYGGNDTINGQSGADTICGGDGDDIISGQSQDDTIFGEAGNDTISGDSGADTIDGGPGDDTITGDSQNDTIQGGDGNDNINGGPGNDTLDGGNDTDTLDGSWGTDTCDDAEFEVGCEFSSTGGWESGLIVNPSSNDTSAPVVLSETRSVDGDGNLASLTGSDTQSSQLLWDPLALVPQIVVSASNRLVYGMQREFTPEGMSQYDARGNQILGDVGSRNWTPFGHRAEREATPTFGFRGELETLGGVDLRARMLVSSLGVFQTRDALLGVPGETVSGSPYHYAKNDPVQFIDPLGMRSVDHGMNAGIVCALLSSTACSVDGQGRAHGIDPEFIDHVIIPILAGEIPSWRPARVDDRYEGQGADGWVPVEMDLLNRAFNSHFDYSTQQPGIFTTINFQNYRDGEDFSSGAGHVFDSLPLFGIVPPTSFDNLAQDLIYAAVARGVYSVSQRQSASRIRFRPTLTNIRNLGNRVAPPGWKPRVADNGKGHVWEAPGINRSANQSRNSLTMRIMEPTSRYPNGYVRFYNGGNQAVNLFGKPGSNAATHFPMRSDGSFLIPSGWP